MEFALTQRWDCDQEETLHLAMMAAGHTWKWPGGTIEHSFTILHDTDAYAGDKNVQKFN